MKKNNVYFISVISKVLLTLLTFINSIFINRYLGPSLKGEYSLVINIASIAALIIGLNITSSYAFFNRKYGSIARTKIVNIIYIQVVISIAVGIIIIFFNKSDKFIIFTIILTIVQQFNNQIDFLGIVIDVNKRNKILLIASCIYSIILFIIYMKADTSIELIIYSLLIFNCLKIVLLILNNKIYPTIINSKNYPKTIEIIKYSSISMLNDLLTNLNYNLDIIILSFFVSKSQIGIYSLAVSLASMAWIIPDAFKEVLFNRTTTSDSLAEIAFSIKFNIYTSILIFIAFAIFGNQMINLIYGNDFSGSFYITLILLLGSLPMIFFKMINTLYLSNGNQQISARVTFIALVLETGLNILFIPHYGIFAAAISSVLSYVVSGAIMFKTFRRSYDISLKQLIIFNKNDISNLLQLIKNKK